MNNSLGQSAQAQQSGVPQVNPQSLLNAMQRQRDAALNQLAVAEAQSADLGGALQQAAAENEALRTQNAQLQAQVDALNPQAAAQAAEAPAA